MKRTERVVRLLPAPAKAMAKTARHRVDPIFVAAYRRRSGERAPIPPSAVRARSGSPGVRSFLVGGRKAAQELENALATVGRSIEDFTSVLDFGCSSGRVLRHLLVRDTRGTTTYYGSDVDAQAIAWAQQHLPGARWVVNTSLPPLPFEDGQFDLIYSISVLTHLDEQRQLAWLDEIHRLLRPGGIALLTTHGAHAFTEFKAGRVISNSRSCMERIAAHGSLAAEGFIYEPYEISKWNKRDFPGISDSFGLTFHSEDYVRRRWADQFEILGILPRALASWQDIVIVQRRDAA